MRNWLAARRRFIKWINLYPNLNDSRAIKKTLTLHNWLNTKAEKAGINFSQVLQEALKEKLGKS